MKRFLYFLFVAHSALFSSELVLYGPPHDESDIVACHKHTIPELILDCKLKNTDNYDDIENDGFLLLKMREVQSCFNTLIENTTHIRHAIGTGNMANLLPYLFLGLPQRPQYEMPERQVIGIGACIIGYGPIILLNELSHISKKTFTGLTALSCLTLVKLLQESPRFNQIALNFGKPIFAPYFYHQWKKEQNKHDVIEYNLDFVTNKENTLLSKSFEDLLMQHCFDTDAPWYEYVLFNPRSLKTIYGKIVHIDRCDETISYPNWPANLEISVITKEYQPKKSKRYKLIDFSDEFFKESSEASYKNELPSDVIVDIKVVPKTGAHIAWNHTLNRIDIEAWFKEFCSEHDNMENKKIILNCRVHRHYFDPETGDINQELWKNIEFTRTLFSDRYNVINL